MGIVKKYSSSFAIRCALVSTILIVAALVRGLTNNINAEGKAKNGKQSVLLRKLLSSREPVFRPIPPKALQENNTDIVPDNTTHAKIKHCTEPAYHEFPQDAFTQTQRNEGAVILHAVMVVYMFTALAIICDVYFVSSLQKICERLNLSEDVAGATFMAAGSSAPELFTSIIGVFIAKGDVGVGTIVGSAVFNILFVIGICAVLAGQVVKLTWWPLIRDSTFYSLSVVALMCSIADRWITWYESLIMLLLYVVYIIFMRFNPIIRDWMYAHVHIFNRMANADDTSSILPQQPEKKFYGNYEIFDNEDEGTKTAATRRADSVFMVDEHLSRSPPKKLSFEDACFRFQITRRFRPLTRFSAACRIIISERQKLMQDPVFVKRQRLKHLSYESESSSYTKAVRRYLTIDEDEEAYDDWIKIPALDQGAWNIFTWVVLYPIRLLLYVTVPDCRKKRWDRWWIATFSMSIVWIAFFSYIMVWMVVLIGYTLGIPDSIMGITFLAAGTSVPDAMASVMVAKQGAGDMAVSNTIGSNVFDVLIGLALPWFLRTGLAFPGTMVYINSNGMIVSVVLLFFTVILTIVTIHLCGWKLDRRVGIVCLVSYAVFLLFAILTEFNVFGYVNLPMCRE